MAEKIAEKGHAEIEVLKNIVLVAVEGKFLNKSQFNRIKTAIGRIRVVRIEDQPLEALTAEVDAKDHQIKTIDEIEMTNIMPKIIDIVDAMKESVREIVNETVNEIVTETVNEIVTETVIEIVDISAAEKRMPVIVWPNILTSSRETRRRKLRRIVLI